MLTEIVQEEVDAYGMPDYDGIWKNVIRDLFKEFMLFFAPDLHSEIDFNVAPDFLQQELFKEIIKRKKGRNIADQIVKVHLQNGEDKWVLIHIEVRDRNSEDFSKRMFRYFYRIYDKFDREVYAIALMTGDQNSQYSDSFHYDSFGTTLDYTYNIYKFHDHEVLELEESNNPFALAIIAGKYASKYKSDTKKRFHFKIQLMKQVLRKYSLEQGESRRYITALFYFIDYLLRTPNKYEEELRNKITKFIKKDGEEHMREEEEILSPTLAGVLEMLKQEEIEKAMKKGKSVGNKEAKISFAVALIKDGFQNERIAKLTGLSLKEIVELRKTL